MLFRLIALALLLAPIAEAQSPFGCRQLSGVNVDQGCIQLSGSNLLDNNGNKLAAGIAKLTVTDQSGNPTTYTAVGGSPSTAPFIASVVNGQVQNISGFPFSILNILTSTPTTLLFHYQLESTNGSVIYLDVPLWDITSTTGGYSLDQFSALPGTSITGLGYPRTFCAPGAKYTPSDNPSGAKPWLCSNLFRTDKSNQWTQNPSANPQCGQGQAIVSPRTGPPYCILPENAYALPGEGFINPNESLPGPLQVDPLNQSAQLPDVQTVLSGNNAGGAVGMPEEGTTLVAGTPNTATVAWKEDVANGFFDCRNPKYAGGCLGSTPGLAMQAFSNQLTCYEAETGKHAWTFLPPGGISLGTPANPTLIMPAGANVIGWSGYYGARTTFQATYNNVTAVKFTAPVTPTAACADGTTPTDSLTGGSRAGFSEHGCNQGGCVNAPGDSGNYPLGGPLQIGIDIEDGGGSDGKSAGVFASNNGGDGVICGGLDEHCYELGGKANNYYFYYGIDQSGQNYQFSGQECHGEVDLGSGDGLFVGPFETYGTFMVPGAEYGSVAGICWGGGLTQLANVFAQVEEIDVIHAGAGSNLSSFAGGGRLDLPEGATYYDKAGGGTTIAGIRTFGACSQNPATDYFVREVTTATPGSGQVPGTYLIVASGTGATIQVVVDNTGAVSTNPLITIHGRGNPPTPVPTFTMPSGAVGSGVAATFTVNFQSYQWERHAGSGTTDTHCNVIWDDSGGGNVYVGNQLTTATPGFGTTYPTHDAFVFGTASWVANKGTLPNGKVSMDQPNDGAYWAGQAQQIWDADFTQAYGVINTTGSVLNLDTSGNLIFLGNTSPTTLTSVTGSHMSADIKIYGDGFTTVPYVPLSASNAFGFDTCGKHPLLLQRNTLYHFKISGGTGSGSPPRMAEFCDPPNDDWRQQNFFGLATLPPTNTLAANHTAGSEAVTALPLTADATISSAGAASAFQYCYLERAWVAGGTMLNHPVCTDVTPVVPTPSNNVFIHWPAPNDWTEYQVIFQSTTDSSFTSSLGVILDVTAPTAFPQPVLADINFAVQPPLTPTGPIVSTSWYGVKMTGTHNIDPTDIPQGTSWPGVPNQMQIDAANNKLWVCTAADTWKSFTLTTP